MRAGRGRLTTGGRRRPNGWLASLRSPLTALVVTLSLAFQLVAIPYHQALAAGPALASDTTAIAAELKATFGDAAALCIQVDEKGAPSHAPGAPCDDQCPLCQFAAQVAALVVPEAPALPARLDLDCRPIGFAVERGVVPVRARGQNRARAPPFAI